MELTVDQALQEGVAAHREGKFQDAERLYRAILQARPNHPDANHNLGVLAVAIGKPLEAIPLFKLALEANPRIDQFWFSYIDALIKLERIDEAKRVVAEGEKSGVSAEKLKPFYGQIHTLPSDEKNNNRQGLKVSEKRRRLAEKKKSKKKKKPATSSGTAPSQNQINRLLEYYQSDRFAETEELAESLTHQFPEHSFAWKALGTTLQQTGRFRESLTPLERSVALSPHDAEAISNLGNALRQVGRLDEAEAMHDKAVAVQPDYAEAHNNLGNTLRELGNLDKAAASLLQAIALKPDFAEAHSNLGLTLKELGRLDDAEASFRQAIALKPDFAEAHNNLGITLKDLGRLDVAEASFKRAIALKPDLAEAHNNLGLTLEEAGKLDKAEESYRQAIALKPDYAEAQIYLGHTLRRLGKLDEAKASYQQAIALKPKDSSTEHFLAALSSSTTASAPLDYVEGLFDSYASKFEHHLVGNLGYQTPKVIANLILRHSNSNLLGSISDLGCGTGLLGEEIKEFCGYLEGVDISRKMLAEAEKKGVYDELIKQDIVTYLSNANLQFDYFIATDVFVYVGDLANVFHLIKSRNGRGGKFVFSTENYDGDDFFLEQSGRYSHSKTYIEDLSKKYGYVVRHFETRTLRKQNFECIVGGLYILDF